MRSRARLKFGVYEERYRPICEKCKKRWPECLHSQAPKRVVLLAGPEQIWMQLNGTKYPAVRVRRFNDLAAIDMVMTETDFRSGHTYIGRFTTHVSSKEVLDGKAQ